MMKRIGFIALLLLAGLTVRAQEKTMTLDEAMQSAEQWAKENLDQDTLRALENVDREKVKEFFASIQKDFHGEYVIDLAQLRDTARLVLPLLESHEETLPYALWLKPRLDYLDAADELRLRIPPPKTEPGETNPPPANPKPQAERDDWIKKLSDRPWPEQAKPYVPRLKEIFTEQKVPPELIWIAEVESSFDRRAESPAGAAGLFQLMPGTAKQYGVSLWPFDERFQADESARAAARYLDALYRKFKDWRLALAAYNAGDATVQNLLKRYKATSYDAIATHLPAETQLYVPKVEAVLLRREGVKLSDLSRPPG
jgi:membrane-bound lytic murein transglycosylase D